MSQRLATKPRAGRALTIGAGAPVALPAGHRVWRVAGGPAEVYLQTPAFRTMLAAVLDGGCVFSLDPAAAPDDDDDDPDADSSAAAFLCVTGPDGTRLEPLPEDAAEEAGLVAGAEHWLAAVAALLRDPPARGAADAAPAPWRLGLGEDDAVPADLPLTSAGGVVWVLLEAGETLSLGGRPPALAGPLAVPLTPALRVERPAGQPLATAGSEDLRREGRLGDAVAAFNGCLPALLGTLRRHRDRFDLERIARRGDDRPGSGQPRHPAAAAEAVRALCRSFGVEPPGRLKVRDGDFAELPLVLRQAGLRARRIALPAGWWRLDLGPLVAMDEESGEAVALIRRRGRYIAETGAAATRFVVDRRSAGRIGPAYAVHPPLPLTVTGFLTLARHLLPEVLRDAGWAVAAGAGTGLAGVLVPMATGWLLSDIVPGRLPGLLAAVGLALVAAALFSALFSATLNIALQRIAGRTGIQVAAALADRVLRLAPGFFREFSPADLNQRIEAVDHMRRLITTTIISTVIALAFSMFYLGLLLIYDLRMGLLSLLLVAVYVAGVALARLAQRRHLRSAARQEGETAAATYEALAGIAKLRVAGAEDRALARWTARYRAELGSYSRIGRIASHFDAFSDAFQTVTLLTLFAAAALLVSRDLPAGIFIGFLVAFGAFQGAFTGFCDSLLSVFAAAPMAERAQPILATPGESFEGRADPGPLAGGIEISGLTFGYGAGGTGDGGTGASGTGDGGRKVLQDFSLTVKPGQQVAIVGASGSGKSTLFRLLLGFEAPGRGSITYDGQDLARLDLAAVRRQIGVVMQSSRLFAGTIQENIRGASDAGLADCLEAAAQAGLAGDLERLPMGLHTPIVEGAGTLSGGQKQRILIARALVAKPTILFLDEATSALDNATQARVTESLGALGATRIVVAHRLTTVREADRICVLAGGRIVESGTFDELMAIDGLFADLARRQLTRA